jgi:hypothetical protein
LPTYWASKPRVSPVLGSFRGTALRNTRYSRDWRRR